MSPYDASLIWSSSRVSAGARPEQSRLIRVQHLTQRMALAIQHGVIDVVDAPCAALIDQSVGEPLTRAVAAGELREHFRRVARLRDRRDAESHHVRRLVAQRVA